MKKNNLSLLLDLYELTMAQAYFEYKKNTCATFDLFVRNLPNHRSYLVAAGLADVLDFVKNIRFDDEAIGFLRSQKLFSKEFLRFLKDFRFRGEIWAMQEGEIFFANEPVIRVTAPIIEAQILESFMLNTINLATMIASKAIRVICAAEDKKVYDFSLRRTHGQDAAIKVSRASYLAGFSGTSNVLAGKIYKIPIVGTMAHSFVMSFKQEMESFLAYSNAFPKKTILLVDTYDTKKGIKNAVKLGLYLKQKGYRLGGIRLDSADIVSLSKLARRMLDKANLNYVNIFASGNLDEFKIKDLLDRGAKIDSFGVGTNMGTSIDAPCLDVIYKISEVTDENGKFLPTMKLSKGKVTYPGRKQIFRIKDKKGKFIKDILGLEKEKIKGMALLKKVLDKGRIIYKPVELERIKNLVKANLSKFPTGLTEIYSPYRYPVLISPGLKKLRKNLSKQLQKRQ